MHTYSIVYKPLKNMYLRLDENNQLLVNAPLAISEKKINDFVGENLLKMLKRKNLKLSNSYLSLNSQVFCLLGERLKLQIVHTTSNVTKFSLENDVLSLWFNPQKPESWKNLIKKFYLKKAQELIPNVVYEFAKSMNTTVNNVNFRWLKSRWGSCAYRTKTLLFAAQLIAFPPEYIRYVVIHELAHTFHPNHSNDFWNCVSTYMPDCFKIRKLLKLQG